MQIQLDLPGLNLIKSMLQLSNSSTIPDSQTASQQTRHQTFSIGSEYALQTTNTSVYTSRAADLMMAGSGPLEPTSQEHAQNLSSLVSHGVEDSSWSCSTEHLWSKSVAGSLSSQALFPQGPNHLLEELNSQLCSPELVCDLVRIGCAMFLLSNNNLPGLQFEGFVRFMVSQPLQQLRRCLYSISSECLQRFLDGVLITPQITVGSTCWLSFGITGMT